MSKIGYFGQQYRLFYFSTPARLANVGARGMHKNGIKHVQRAHKACSKMARGMLKEHENGHRDAAEPTGRFCGPPPPIAKKL